MEFKENVDHLMCGVTISREMHRAIMEGSPGKERHRVQGYKSNARGGSVGAGSGMARRGSRDTVNGMALGEGLDAVNGMALGEGLDAVNGMDMGKRVGRKGGMNMKMKNSTDRKNRRKSLWRQAAVPAAAALLVMSTMYVGAGYLIGHTPLRDIFTAEDGSALPVPEGQQRPDIYGEILDDSFSALGNQAGAGTETGGGSVGETGVSRGKYGEVVIDNELFSIELLETTCAGRELTASYILTKKTDQILTVDVSIDNDYMAQWHEGGQVEEFDVGKSLGKGKFGESFQWNKLPAGCGYELAENQELCMITQFGKTDYATGAYTLYAESYLHEDNVPAGDGGEPFMSVGVSEEDIQRDLCHSPIEIRQNGNYGLDLGGDIDKTEGSVHFGQYEVYISPMTVYLTLYGTYEGEMSSIWGMGSSHDITIGFRDGSQTEATVLLSSMGYGNSEINVDMRASFNTAIDPDSIVKVILDGVVIMGE